MNNALDPIILGHNPFFGVNHLNQGQGDARAETFESESSILNVLKTSQAQGVQAIMLSTHPRVKAICDLLRDRQHFPQPWTVYPLLPNIQKYVRGANEKGLVNMVNSTLSQADTLQKLSLLWSGGKGLLKKDISGILTTLVDVEMLPFKGLPIGAIFLHDALTDLALGLKIEAVLDTFRDHVMAKYDAPAGLTTKNVGLLRERLAERGWTNPLIMASLNAAGFYANPNLESSAAAVQQPGIRFVAMNTLASGALSPDTAYPYLASFGTLESIVVGVSREAHMSSTFGAIRRYIPAAKRSPASQA
jgi:hypothetical protein